MGVRVGIDEKLGKFLFTEHFDLTNKIKKPENDVRTSIFKREFRCLFERKIK